MKILDKLVSRCVKKEGPEDPMKIAKIIGPLIDKTAHDIFVSYSKKLVTEPITYIVPAVWGAKKNGELTISQKEMHKKIAPNINEIMVSLELGEISEAKKFAIGFIIRGYIISKITYMIEMVKNRGIKSIASENEEEDILGQIEPLGNA